MKIGFDVSQTGEGKAGCGYFAASLIRALIDVAPENEYVLFPSFGDFYFDPSIQFRRTHSGNNIDYGPDHNSAKEAADFWNSPNLKHHLAELDIIHANNFWCPRQILRTKVVYTLYDLSFIEDPSWTTEANRVGCFAGVFGAAVGADWIIAISHWTRKHFLGVFPSFPSERIEVMHPSSRFASANVQGGRPKRLKDVQAGYFWLSVGTIEPRKNQKRLVEAYARYLELGGPKIPLVLAGGTGWLMEDFSAFVTHLDISDLIIMTGYVEDEELVWLYRNCYAHIYVSLFEGFGLPVLEGIQFAAATIASRSTSIPEIVNDAGILVDPLNTDEITRALLEVGTNERRRGALSELARRRSDQFAWDRSAERVAGLYHRVAEAPKRRIASGQASVP
jgi:glycosyltransferase involved in cell wall biosynthesis